jgi:hypothetical protein
VDDVGGEVREDDQNGQQDDDALDDGEVARIDRLDEEIAHAGVGEHGLDDDRSAKKDPDTQPDDDRRCRERVVEHVTHDRALSEAARSERVDEVLVLHFEETRPQYPDELCCHRSPERDRGENDVSGDVPRPFPVGRQDGVGERHASDAFDTDVGGHHAAHGENRYPDGQKHDEHDALPETGHRHTDQGERGPAAIEECVLSER